MYIYVQVYIITNKCLHVSELKKAKWQIAVWDLKIFSLPVTKWKGNLPLREKSTELQPKIILSFLYAQTSRSALKSNSRHCKEKACHYIIYTKYTTLYLWLHHYYMYLSHTKHGDFRQSIERSTCTLQISLTKDCLFPYFSIVAIEIIACAYNTVRLLFQRGQDLYQWGGGELLTVASSEPVATASPLG